MLSARSLNIKFVKDRAVYAKRMLCLVFAAAYQRDLAKSQKINLLSSPIRYLTGSLPTMAFHRSREAPMEFEYDHRSFDHFSALNTPPIDQGTAC